MRYCQNNMRRAILFSSVFLFVVFFSQSVAAHGRFSVFQVNGESARANAIADDVPPSSITIPLDIAPKDYLTGESIAFSVNSAFLPEGTKNFYEWNFGDGGAPVNRESGTHMYTKAGTYIVTVTETPETGQPAMTLSVSIKPSAEYITPQAKINVNGKTIEDPFFDTIEIKPGRAVTFDAASSIGSIKIYAWDFGDKETGEGKTVSHVYGRKTQFPVYAFLRITDENGLTADTYVIVDMPLGNQNPFVSFIDAIRDFFANLFERKG